MSNDSYHGTLPVRRTFPLPSIFQNKIRRLGVRKNLPKKTKKAKIKIHTKNNVEKGRG